MRHLLWSNNSSMFHAPRQRIRYTAVGSGVYTTANFFRTQKDILCLVLEKASLFLSLRQEELAVVHTTLAARLPCPALSEHTLQA